MTKWTQTSGHDKKNLVHGYMYYIISAKRSQGRNTFSMKKSNCHHSPQKYARSEEICVFGDILKGKNSLFAHAVLRLCRYDSLLHKLRSDLFYLQR